MSSQLDSTLFNARIRFVSGKGGVGKSSLTLALALIGARHGKRVLLCETNPQRSVARLIETEPLTGEVREVLPGIHMVALIPKECIREYARMIIRFAPLYKMVFENQLVQHFLSAVPSLAEMVMLGKLWFHDGERDGSRLRYDWILVDSPASGHLLSLLRAPESLARLLNAGPMRKIAADLGEMLHNPARTRLDIVTAPEELPINEWLEVDALCAEEKLCTRGLTFMNRILPPLSAEAALHLKRTSSRIQPLIQAMAQYQAWQLAGVHALSQLSERNRQNLICIEKRPLEPSGFAQIEAFSHDLEQILVNFQAHAAAVTRE